MSDILTNLTSIEVTVNSAQTDEITVNTIGGPLGPVGPQGPIGPQGPPGIGGAGIPPGGTLNQVLTKNSSTDFDDSWKDPLVKSVAGRGGAVTLVESDIANLPSDLSNKYSLGNPPPYPVTSVAGRGGAVTLAESDIIGLLADLNLKAPLASPVFTGTVTVPTTVNATDAAQKAYVDGVAQGLVIKQPVNEATTTALPTNTYNNGSSGVGATLTGNSTGVLTIDGQVVALNDRVLVKDEAATANNGIYTCTTAGAVGVAYVLTRATDMNLPSLIKGAFAFVETGTVNANSGFVVGGAGPFTIGTTAISWSQFSGAGTLGAGSGITITGAVISANDATTSSKGIVELANDLAGSATSPTVVGLHLATDTSIGHKLTNLTNGSAASDAAAFGQIPTSASTIGGLLVANNLSDIATPATAFSNIKQAATTLATGVIALNQDLSGTASNPTVTSTHLSAPLPVAQGGTNSPSAQSAINVLTSITNGSTGGKFLRSNGTNATWQTVIPGDLPDATTSAKGIIELSGGLGGVGSTALIPVLKNVQKIFNVKDLGAVGDNVTDDGDAINATISLAGANGVVYFPAATYYSTKQHVPLQGQTWFGDGKGISTIRGNRGFDYSIYFVGSSGTPLQNCTLRDMTLDADNVGSASNLQLYYASNCRIERVGFKNVTSGGWMLKLGVTNGATDTFLNDSNKIIDCDFDTHAGSLEMLLLYNCKNTQVIRPKFINNGAGPTLGLWQKCYDTKLIDPIFINNQGVCIYYSVTVENTSIDNPYFENCGQAISGANSSDNGNFGLTHAEGLFITNPQLKGGANSTTSIGIQLGSVNNVVVAYPDISGYQVGMRVDNGNHSNTNPATNFTIIAPEVFNNNATNDFHLLHPGILFAGVGGSLYGKIIAGSLYDNQGTPTQRFPIVFDGAFTWDNIDIIANRLSADIANSGTSVALGDGALLGGNVYIANNQDYSGTNPPQAAIPSATSSVVGGIALAGDIGGSAASPKVKRTSRFIVAPYGDTRPADYTCATATGNDTEINQAIVAANALPGGGVVELLDGSFTISNSIMCLPNVHIKGRGMFMTKIGITNTASQSIFDMDKVTYNGTNPLINCEISDLEIDGSNMNQTNSSKGINGGNFKYLKLSRLYVHDTTATGIGDDDFYGGIIDRCITYNCGYVNKHTITAASWAANVFTYTTADAHGYAAWTQATGTLTAAGTIANGDTVTLDTITYTFKTTLTGAAYEVSINGSTANALLNLQKAVNLSGVAGTDYGTGTEKHPTVTAGSATSTTLPFSASNYGTSGNSIVTGTTGAAASFGASTLTGGVSGSKIVVAGMTPALYNGTYNVTSIVNSTTFTISSANNSGQLNFTTNPGTATGFGTTSDSLIGHNGFGIASGNLTEEATSVSNCIAINNQNNNFLIEADSNNSGANASYQFVNCISIRAGSVGFQNTGSLNTQYTNCYDYGSPIGAQSNQVATGRTITVASWSASVATFTTSVAHGFVVGNRVTISNLRPTAYNGYYTIQSVPTATTFTVNLTSNPGTALTSGNAQVVTHPVDGTTYTNIILSNNLNYGMKLPSQSDGIIGNSITINGCLNIGLQLNSSFSNFNNLRIYGCGQQGLYLLQGGGDYAKMRHTSFSNLNIYNNGNRVGLKDGIDISSSTTAGIADITFNNIHGFDDQDTKTQRYGAIIRSGGNNSNIFFNGGDLSGNATAPILVQDTSNTIYVNNVGGVNPLGKSDLGSVTGSPTFDASTASYFTAMLTANMTPVMPASLVKGTMMTWVLTQDSTGGRTLTLPSNAAAATTLTLSTAANAIDTITWAHDGSKWREVSHAFAQTIQPAQAITVSANAGTADVNYSTQNFTNSSAAGMMITLATASAADGQTKIIRIYDASAVAQAITWVNTENSTVTVPATSNGSATLPLSVGFIFNGLTARWRCIAVV